MKFIRTPEYQNKLFLEALGEHHVKQDATIEIIRRGGKLKAYCAEVDCFLQFPRSIRKEGRKFTADIIEVVNDHVTDKYYRVVKSSIRREGSDEVVEC